METINIYKKRPTHRSPRYNSLARISKCLERSSPRTNTKSHLRILIERTCNLHITHPYVFRFGRSVPQIFNPLLPKIQIMLLEQYPKVSLRSNSWIFANCQNQVAVNILFTNLQVQFGKIRMTDSQSISSYIPQIL